MANWHRLACTFTVVFLCSLANSAYGETGDDGIAMFKTGRYNEALSIFQKVLPTKRNDPNLLYYYALTLHRVGDTATAKNVYNQIITKFPESGAAVYARQALGLPQKLKSTPTAQVSTASSSPEQSGKPASPSTTSLPPDFPVPVYPHSVKVVWEKPYDEATVMNTPAAEVLRHIAGAGGDIVHFLVPAANGEEAVGKEVVSFYKKEFASRGWRFLPRSASYTEDFRGNFEFRKDSSRAAVSIYASVRDSGFLDVSIDYQKVFWDRVPPAFQK